MTDRSDLTGQSDPTASAAAATGTTATSRSSAPKVRLSCEACRQRKVKCDKLSPCTSCVRLGFVCVPVERARLPRGRTRKAPERAQGSDKELVDRVAKLEKLLKQVAAERDGETAQPQQEPPRSIATAGRPQVEQHFETKMQEVESWRDQNIQSHTLVLPHRPRPSTSYIASSFWEDIMQQTQELRTVLDDRLEYEQADEEEARNLHGFGASLVGSETSESMTGSPQSQRGLQIPPHVRRQLCEIYLRNVDPVFKILHRPSLRAYLCDEQPYLDYEQDHQAPVTLAWAVFYAAACTIDDAQCQLLFGMDKKPVTAELQRETEAGLVKSDFVTTNELTVLQAYVLSLLAARCQDQSRRVWTMSSMALRVGQALCLHMPVPPFHVGPFEQELRRRTWQAIGVLDLAASLDRASEPMMQSVWLDYVLPANINDEDISHNMDVQFQERPETEFTDMTQTLIIAAAQSVARSIGFTDFIEPTVRSSQKRQEVLANFRKTANNRLANCSRERSAYHLYVSRITHTLFGWLQMGCVRPIQRNKNWIPPPVEGDVLLSLAADNLQKLMEIASDPAMQPWTWFGSLWVPWHGLAVALAEICVCKDPESLIRHWPPIEQVYHQSSFVIADSQHGMLWKPLQKLMTQARAHRKSLLGSNAFTAADSYASPPQPPVQQSAPVPLAPITSQYNIQSTMAADTAGLYALGQQQRGVFAAGQQYDTSASMAAPAFTLEPWPSVWDQLDFMGNPGMQTQADNNAWLNYESFIGDVYDSVDCTFQPR
ncbi:Fungal Zn(2)-Cys(6) binuclear cluster domain-containing protein [Penicillium ucsense]|uniref:Fungal Zn(2)-Cys(6) binuclear cluster domain-containing protein n=1 Tax=Penicillium ucsense TaxID=2839758 RepID=A0A8J8WA41_9EURO|nr:Fungal Zn(2)-Cys(6) binuclear cluster domain-containing protein [Penicillium ucsense]KAF7737274.1 Fungal Zn(2)-Cys(6) binuclear cluster domain-containing protein [Penicillium ucsense]